ncbi:MAG TPA: ABC transporter substrate-binding protein [Acetobacteraceae bacterium]|jgi:phospholipid transport system substrate-binding protein
MLHRRSLLSLATGAALAAGLEPARADSTTQSATAFVTKTGSALVAVVNGAGSAQDKRQKLTSIIDQTVDVDGVAKFCLGRFWRQASPDQQQRYIKTFHQVLVSNITAKLGEYQGVRFNVNRAVPNGEQVQVDTTVLRPNQPPTDVQWVIGSPSSDPKIVDVVAEGTSLRLTQRSDYASYLSHNSDNINALIAAMQHQVEANQANG